MTILENLKVFLKSNNNVISYNSLSNFLEKEANITITQCLDEVIIDKAFRISATIESWACDILIYLYKDLPNNYDINTLLPVKSIVIVFN